MTDPIFSTAASTCTPWKSCDANNGRVISVGTSSSDNVCGCKATYYLMNDAVTCAPCSACSDGLTMITPCMATSDTVCGLVTPCVSTLTGIASKFIYPQGCFACSTSQASSQSLSASAQNTAGLGGSVGASQSSSSAVQAGFCCDTKTQDCTHQFCTVKGDATRKQIGWAAFAFLSLPALLIAAQAAVDN